MPKKPVMLIIMDGWGVRTTQHGNAVVQANTPNYDKWTNTLERSLLDASGEAVGLVPDQMGNSEVGHLNLGAGRIVYQDISRIDIAIRDGSLAKHPLLTTAIEQVKQTDKNIHLVGLLGPGGVHSHENHMYALLDIAKDADVNPVIHVITDGRDTPPRSGATFLQTLTDYIKTNQHGRIASVSGRYYAMDRDKRWERTQQAYDAMVNRQGLSAPDAETAIQQAYAEDITDEFIVPTVIGNDDSLRIQPGDVIICFNFRADRMRQIVRAWSVEAFDDFPTSVSASELSTLTFTQYADDLPTQILFPIEILESTLAETLSKHGLTQYHSAETEKYPHVTYFFNGRNEEVFPGEDRSIIPSPKVATYDLQPEMSAPELTNATLDRIATHDDNFILVNFANPDMVGHTGSLEAATKACETVDASVKQLADAVVAKGGVALVTADHGNSERMIDEVTGTPHTYHTTSLVPFFLIGKDYYMLRPNGILADVAPTVLDLLEIEKPTTMTGRSLIEGIRLQD